MSEKSRAGLLIVVGLLAAGRPARAFEDAAAGEAYRAIQTRMSLQRGIEQEPFLPGRLESRHLSRQIAAKCALRDVKSACVAYRFYHLESPGDAAPRLISKDAFTNRDIQNMKVPGVFFNVFNGRNSADEEPTITQAAWELISDYDMTFGDSVAAEAGDAAAAGAAYVVLTPLAAAFDVAGNVIGTPFYLLHKAARNSKINKLIRAIETGKIVKINVGRLENLGRDLRDEKRPGF